MDLEMLITMGCIALLVFIVTQLAGLSVMAVTAYKAWKEGF